MSLSPIAQYCIRKLLRQNLEHLDRLFVPVSKHANLSDAALDRILQTSSFASGRPNLQLQELELLTKLYQQLERNPSNQVAIAEIKRRIFQTLGFQLNAKLPTQLPLVIDEPTIDLFRFYHQDQVREGMRYANDLYAAAYQFNSRYRLQAYQLAWALYAAKVPLVVSLSPQRIVIWINLQSPTYLVLIRQATQLLKTVLSLNLALQKGKTASKSSSILNLVGKEVVTVSPKSTDSRDH